MLCILLLGRAKVVIFIRTLFNLALLFMGTNGAVFICRSMFCKPSRWRVKSAILTLIWLGVVAESIKEKQTDGILFPQKYINSQASDTELSLLRSILLAAGDNPVILISDMDSVLENLDLLPKHVAIYNDPTLDVASKSETMKYDTNENLLYIYLLKNYQVFQPLSLVSRIRQRDFTSNILFIMNQATSYDEFVNVFEKERYHEVYFAVASRKNNFEFLEICLFCNKGENSIEKMNEWNGKSGLTKPLIFPKSFKGNFHGSDLVVTTHFTFAIIENIGGELVGIEYFLLLQGASKLNYKIRFNNPAKKYWGSLVNGK